MAYQQNDPILTDHYNQFIAGTPNGTIDNNVPNLNSLWGVGNKDKGYGQTAPLLPVTNTDTITAVQWSSLLSKITTIGSHQGTTLTATTSPAPNDLITAIAAISANITAIDTNKLTAATTGTSDSIVASASASWTVVSTHTIQVQFPTADAARYFFNAGGHIDLSFSRSGGSVSQKNTDWTNLLNDVGIIRLTAFGVEKVGGSGSYGGGATDIIYNNGYYNWVNGGGSRVFRQFASGSVYTSNSIDVFAETEGAQGINADNGGLVTFIITMSDAAGDPPPVDGTMTATALVRYPSSTFLTDASWGIVTFPTATVTQS